MKTIELTHGKVAIVDDEDYATLVAHRWFAVRLNYDPRHEIWAAFRRINRVRVYMHREILGLNRGDGMLHVMHVNGNRLDNRRGNLVVPGRSIVSRCRRFGLGTSQFKGVKSATPQEGWYAAIYIDGKTRYLGRFATEVDAALAYDVAARKAFGRLSALNFPEIDTLTPPRQMPPKVAKTSKYRGVTRLKNSDRWAAQITIDGKRRCLGRFASEADAALAYDFAARKTFGHLVGLNFPDLDVLAPPKTMPRALRAGRASKYRGVFWCNSARKWRAMMQVGSRRSNLGLYGSEDDAARAYDAVVLRQGKGREWLNFPHTNASGCPPSEQQVNHRRVSLSGEIGHDDDTVHPDQQPQHDDRTRGLLGGLRAFFAGFRRHFNREPVAEVAMRHEQKAVMT
jgi:hypothetical protein